MGPNMPASAEAASANPACFIRTARYPNCAKFCRYPKAHPEQKTPFPHCEYVKVHMGTWVMSPGEVAASYRLYAVYCADIAQTVTDSARKVALLDMAQAWARLAEVVDKDRPLEETSATTP
jgi:hypothetical protein